MSRTLRCCSISLGCPKNRVDTERLLGSLGIKVISVAEADQADIVFINTCSFIQPAIEESVRTIAQAAADLESMGKTRPLLVVAGCLVGRYHRKILAPELPEVDLWLDSSDLDAWPALLADRLKLPTPAAAGRLLSTGPSYAWLKISDGCRHTCSFCTIPQIRGKLHSYPKEALVREAGDLLDQGVKELILVAQDLTAWGEDLGERHGLRTLLDGILPLPGLERLRLLYLYPASVSNELLQYLRAAGDPFIPYFDIPVQHASSAVLSRMGRPFARNPRKVVDAVRTIFPEAALRTSLIVGFPGETAEDHAELTRFVQEVRFQHLGVFTYSAEEGTAAAAMPDQIDEKIKTARRDELMSIQAEISAQWLAGFMGDHLSILVDTPHPDWPGLHTGRAWFQAPEIDGITYVSGPGVRPGALINAEIVECRDYDLVALA